MNGDIAFWHERLKAYEGRGLLLRVFGMALDAREGWLRGTLRGVALQGPSLVIDLSGEEEILVVEVRDVKDGKQIGDEFRIYAGSVVVRWDFAPPAHRERHRLSEWRCSVTGSSSEGYSVETNTYTSWNDTTEHRNITTTAPAIQVVF